MKTILNKIGNTLLDILVILVLITSVIIVVLSFTSKKNGIPNLFGYTLLSVQTDSMEPTFYVGDLIIGRVPQSDASYEKGDVVTFREIVENTVIYNTHRIDEVSEINGYSYYATKGDNTEGQDDGKLVAGDILSKWTGIRIPFAGSVLDFIRSGVGFFVCLMIPVILFFLYYLYKFIKNLIAYNKENAVEAAKEAAAEVEEDQKARIIAEYLAQQAAQNGAQGTDAGSAQSEQAASSAGSIEAANPESQSANPETASANHEAANAGSADSAQSESQPADPASKKE